MTNAWGSDSGGWFATARYRLDLDDGPTAIPYAWITEIYHPDYLTLADLRALYPEVKR